MYRSAKVRGLTYVEVMVTAVLFLTLMGITLSIMSLSSKADRKSSVASKSYRAAALILRHLRQELRGSRATLTEDDGIQDFLEYEAPEWNGNHIRVDARGLPIFKIPRRLAVNEDGKLIRTEDTDVRILGDLGSGTIAFERTSPRLLSMSVTVITTDGRGSHLETLTSTAQIVLSLADQQHWNNTSIIETF